MENNTYTTFSGQELLAEQKKLKSFSITNAFLIGFLIGIVLVSILLSAYNLALLFPLFLIYKFVNDPRNKKVKELDAILLERKLTK